MTTSELEQHICCEGFRKSRGSYSMLNICTPTTPTRLLGFIVLLSEISLDRLLPMRALLAVALSQRSHLVIRRGVQSRANVRHFHAGGRRID